VGRGAGRGIDIRVEVAVEARIGVRVGARVRPPIDDRDGPFNESRYRASRAKTCSGDSSTSHYRPGGLGRECADRRRSRSCLRTRIPICASLLRPGRPNTWSTRRPRLESAMRKRRLERDA